MRILLEDLNLNAAERRLCEHALDATGKIVEAAQLLGVSRHTLSRKIIKHQIRWPRVPSPEADVSDPAD